MIDFIKAPFKYLVLLIFSSMFLFSGLEHLYTISLYNNLILNMNNALTNATILSSYKTPDGDTPFVRFSQYDEGGISQASLDEGEAFVSTEEYRTDFSDEFGYTMEKVLKSVFHEDIVLTKESEDSSYVEFVYQTNDSDSYVKSVNLTAMKIDDDAVRVIIDVKHGFRMPGMKRLNDYIPALNSDSIKIDKEYKMQLRQQV